MNQNSTEQEMSLSTLDKIQIPGLGDKPTEANSINIQSLISSFIRTDSNLKTITLESKQL